MKWSWLVTVAAGGAAAYMIDEWMQRVELLEHQMVGVDNACNAIDAALNAIDYDGLQKWSLAINERMDLVEARVREYNIDTAIERLAARYLQASEQMRRAVAGARETRHPQPPRERGFPEPPPRAAEDDEPPL